MKTSKLLTLLLIIILSIHTCGCQTTHTKPPTNPSSYSTESFDEFTTQLFVKEVCSDSITLNYTLSNPQKYNITPPTPTYGDMDISKLSDNSSLIEAINTLKSFDYHSLSSSQRLTYDILYDYMMLVLEYQDLYLYTKTLSPTLGLNSQLPIVLAEFTFRTKEDVYTYIDLLKKTDEYFEYILEIEKLKAQKGLFMEDKVATAVIKQCEEFASNTSDNLLITTFNGRIANTNFFTPKELNQLIDENKDAIAKHVLPAYTKLSQGLTKLLGSCQYTGGLCNLPSGNAYYNFLVQESTGSDRSITDIEKLIDEYMNASYLEMSDIIKRDPDIFTKTDSLTCEYSDPYAILDKLASSISPYFPILNDASYTIKYVHPSLEKSLSPAFYMVPAIDDFQDNIIYINNYAIKDYSELFTTLAHEGFPGHLYQNTYTNSQKLAPIRLLLNFGGYCEGWATYVELMSYQLLTDNEELASFLACNQLITLCIYGKCDIGINYHGWSYEDLHKYLSNIFTDIEDAVIEDIYISMVSEPANYLKYILGCLEFMEIKNEALNAFEAKNEAFNLKEFHEKLLNIGPAPFYIIRKYMK